MHFFRILEMKMFLQVEIVFDGKNDAYDFDQKLDKESIYQSIFDILHIFRILEIDLLELREFANLRYRSGWYDARYEIT